MSIDILMPALSPTMEEGTLAKWHVKVGDKVRSGDVIAEIETDKATMEVEAVDEGAIEELLVAEGTEGVKVNAPIAKLSGDDAGGSPPPAPKAEAASPPQSAKPTAPPEGEHEKAPTAQPAPTSSSPSGGGGSPSAAKADGGAQRIFASPLARRIAEQKGLDLSTLKGSGPHGRIVKADVESAQPGQGKAPAAAPAGQPSLPATSAAPRQVQSLEQQGIPAGSYDLIPLDGMRKTVARRMTDSFRDVPHFPLSIDIEIDALLAARAKINAMLEKSGGGKVSVNDMVIKAAAVALMQVKEANASYTPDGIALHHHADIAMAVAVPGGLITPIIRAAETKGLAQIAAEAKDLAERARTKKLKPEEFQGGTFSISNLGMFGIKSFASIINEPQGAILSVGAGEKRPVVRGDQLAVATVMSVTLTCDHRVVDGATGARWLAAFKPLIEDPDHNDRLRTEAMSIYDFTAETLDGKPAPLSAWKDKVVLIVNTASKCGFTPQYEGLEALYKKYGDKGFVVLGFPCNQFGAQEPGDAAEIANFCSLTYEVDFPMMKKIDVNGPDAHPLYRYLKHAKKGLLGSEGIKWNFTKFLVDRTGEVVGRYAPTDTPQSLEGAIEKLL